jgi:hypothetical protein
MNDQEFKQFESDAFGYGYGSGETHLLSLLKKAFDLFPMEGNYDYKVLEQALGAEQFWLLLTLLLKAGGIINYGTSPRYGWLDPKGKELKKYLETRTFDQLYEIVMGKE